MCGIVGLRVKNPDYQPVLGELVAPMLDVLASRGPDSTGVAIYRDDAAPGAMKYSLFAVSRARGAPAAQGRAGHRPGSPGLRPPHLTAVPDLTSARRPARGHPAACSSPETARRPRRA